MHVDVGMSTDHLAYCALSSGWADKDDNVLRNIEPERTILLAADSPPLASPRPVHCGRSQLSASGEGFSRLFAHYRVAGRSYVGEGDEAMDQIASVGYFEVLRARLLQGRYFEETDNISSTKVAVINRTMAKEEFPGEAAEGKSIINQYDPDHPIEIVGVVDDLKDGMDRWRYEVRRQLSIARLIRFPRMNFMATLRSSRAEATILPSMVKAIHQIDAGLIADGEETMIDRINHSQSAYLQSFGCVDGLGPSPGLKASARHRWALRRHLVLRRPTHSER